MAPSALRRLGEQGVRPVVMNPKLGWSGQGGVDLRLEGEIGDVADETEPK